MPKIFFFLIYIFSLAIGWVVCEQIDNLIGLSFENVDSWVEYGHKVYWAIYGVLGIKVYDWYRKNE